MKPYRIIVPKSWWFLKGKPALTVKGKGGAIWHLTPAAQAIIVAEGGKLAFRIGDTPSKGVTIMFKDDIDAVTFKLKCL